MGPYSMDLRERVAAAIDEGEGSERQIAKRFRVSVSFVTRLLQRRRDAGTLASEFRVLAFLGGDEVGIISSYLTSS